MDTCGLGRGLLPWNREACEGLVDWLSLQWRSATPSLTVSGLTLDGNANQEKGIIARVKDY